MIIEKVFSNTEDPEENLYSVLMTEEEMKMFAINAAEYYYHLNNTGAAYRAAKAAKKAKDLEHAFKSKVSVVGNPVRAGVGLKLRQPLPPPTKSAGSAIKVNKLVTPIKRPAPINNGFQMSSTLRPNGGGFQYV